MSGRKRLLGVVAAIGVVALALALLPPRTSGDAAAAPLFEIHAAHETSFVPGVYNGRPIFILALGSDARPGQAVDRERADSIHIIGINPARTHATILGFPRDSWVSIPGVGRNRINSAMSSGGPPLLVRTIENLTGIPIDFWLLTSFGGMRSMVDAIGGVVVDVPYRMKDRFAGTDLQPGRQRLRGWQALAFSRDRHSTPNGDFDRSLNQGRVLAAALAQFRRAFASAPAAAFVWMAVASRSTITDLSPEAFLDLALAATHIPPENVNNLVAPGVPGRAGAASVVFLSRSASRLFADMRADGVIGR